MRADGGVRRTLAAGAPAVDRARMTEPIVDSSLAVYVWKELDVAPQLVTALEAARVYLVDPATFICPMVESA